MPWERNCRFRVGGTRLRVWDEKRLEERICYGLRGMINELLGRHLAMNSH